MHTLQKGFVNAGFIFLPCNFSDADLWAVRLWLGCHILALQDFAAALKKMGLHRSRFGRGYCVCPAHRGAVHVRVANGISFVF